MAHVANVCTVGVHADFQMGRCHQTHIPWFQAAEFGVSKLDVWIFFDPQIVRALECPLKQVGLDRPWWCTSCLEVASRCLLARRMPLRCSGWLG